MLFYNRLSALALSEVGEDPCGLMSAESESSAAPNFLNQRRTAEGRGGGCSFLWLLSFEQAKESHSPKGEKLHLMQHNDLQLLRLT